MLLLFFSQKIKIKYLYLYSNTIIKLKYYMIFKWKCQYILTSCYLFTN